MRYPVIRPAITLVLVLAAAFLIILWNIRVVLPVIAFFVPRWEPLFSDIGAYGFYRSRRYFSYDLTSPHLSTPQWDERCDERGYILLTPKGSSVTHPGPIILNPRGDLVWMSDQYPNAMNLKIQRFKDRNYLTFWSGSKNGGQGEGGYYMLDSSYNIAHTISAVGASVHGDLHEFKITPNGTALITVYNKTTTDLSSIGRPRSGWIYDSVFQEIDIHTNTLLSEWRASEHFDAGESYMTHPLAGYISAIPFDFFHINSVDVDSKGQYLISSRHLHSIVCISRAGETLWVLGGRRNEFTWLPNDRGDQPVKFRWQHDARWLQEPDENGVGVMTLFDNQEGGVLHADGPYSRALKLRLDVRRRTIEIIGEYLSLHKTRAPSQGSVQVLENGNVFVGWGHSAAFSEFSENETLLCESHFGASWFDWAGRAISYRAFKAKEGEWVARPGGMPDVKLKGGSIYVSWNGATEVKDWSLEAQRNADLTDQWEEIDILKKENFEESFELINTGAGMYKRYRVAALDEDGKVMAYSESIEQQLAASLFKTWLAGLVWAGLFLSASVMCKQGLRRWIRRVVRWDMRATR